MTNASPRPPQIEVGDSVRYERYHYKHNRYLRLHLGKAGRVVALDQEGVPLIQFEPCGHKFWIASRYLEQA